MITEYLQKHNLKYEQLNYLEKQTLEDTISFVEKHELNLEQFKDKMRELIDAVSEELAQFNQPATIWEYLFRPKRQEYLRARLKNYLILYNILTAPAKAKKLLEERISNIKKS